MRHSIKCFLFSTLVLSAHSRTAVLLGNTGAGKSTTGNTLCRRAAFQAEDSYSSVTKDVQSCTDVSPQNFHWTVIDTPGFFDTSIQNGDTIRALAKFATLSPHGIDAFLLLLPCPARAGRRFTDQTHAGLQMMQTILTSEAFEHAIIVFSDCGSMTTEQLSLKLANNGNLPVKMQQWLDKVQHRFVAFGNPEEQLRRDSDRVALFDAIDRLAAQRPYDNQIFKEHRARQQLLDRKAAALNDKYRHQYEKHREGLVNGRTTADELDHLYTELSTAQQREEADRRESARLRYEQALLEEERRRNQQERARQQARLQEERRRQEEDRQRRLELEREWQRAQRLQRERRESDEIGAAGAAAAIVGGLILLPILR